MRNAFQELSDDISDFCLDLGSNSNAIDNFQKEKIERPCVSGRIFLACFEELEGNFQKKKTCSEKQKNRLQRVGKVAEIFQIKIIAATKANIRARDKKKMKIK